MTTDIAEQIAHGVYGKSGRANAPENQNADFQSGFAVGSEVESGSAAIRQEWIRIGRPRLMTAAAAESFEEWKRGMWSAMMQRTAAKAFQE